MNKRLRNGLCALFLLPLLNAPIHAQDDYTYTVRIHAGNHGTIDGQSEIVLNDLEAGARINFNVHDAVVTDANSKYVVMGLKESGKDNEEYLPITSFEVNEDKDYVVAYKMLSNATEYTIRYVDNEGNELRDSVTYIGNVGDRPVVSYLYIEGYLPQAYNLTGTLREENNVWEFVYTPVPEGTTTYIPGTTTVIDETTTVTAPAPATPAATTPATTPEATTPTTPGAETPTTPTTPGTEEPATPEGPAEIIDIDDPDTPLAGPEENEDQDSSKSSVSMPLMIGLGALAVVILGGIIYFVVKKKKEKNSK